MKFKKRISFCAMIVLCFALALIFTSCTDSESLAGRGYTVEVIYDYNGGSVDEAQKRVLYYKPDQPLLKPGDSMEFKEPEMNAFYTIDGWYLAKKDENGAVLRDADGKILTEETPFDFVHARATESCTLVAKWKETPTITIKVDGRADDIRTYTEGDSIQRFTYMAGRKDDNGEVLYTFYDYYLDEACTQKVNWPIAFKDEDGKPIAKHVTLYTKWFEGDVLIVRSRSDLAKFPSYCDKTIYLDTDLDLTGARDGFPALTGSTGTFSGTFLGNGHTIRGGANKVTLNKNLQSYGFFGKIAAGAVISDVTFADMTLSATIAWNETYSFGLLASETEKGAQIARVTFENCEIQYEILGSVDLDSVFLRYSKGTALSGILGNAADDANSYNVTGSVSVKNGNENP